MPAARVVAVIDKKGGAGKTTLMLHLAVAAHKAGRVALAVDCDPQVTVVWRRAVSQTALQRRAR